VETADPESKTANLVPELSTHDDNDSQNITDTAEQAATEAQPAMDPLGDTAAVQGPDTTEAVENQGEAAPDESTASDDTLEPPAATIESADSVGVDDGAGALSEQGPAPETAGPADPPAEQTPGTLNFSFVYSAPFLHVSRRFR
jgi:hypothetical protein